MNFDKKALAIHKKLQGKIEISSKSPVVNSDQLSTFYTPGVAEVSKHLADHPEELSSYTWTGNTVAIVSDGSAVLGLGNIGPEGAMPVLEGKCMLFKSLSNVNSVPILLNVHSVEEIVSAIEAIAPSFGAIVLEDIAAPQCFEIEDRLKKSLKIPVMHDDQHATAVVTLAGLINAAKVTDREIAGSKVVVAGAGAAGVAIAKLIKNYADAEIIVTDSRGIISSERDDLNLVKQQLLNFTNPNNISGKLIDAVVDADIFIGVSQPQILSKNMVKSMSNSPIVFAMANPTPEIFPDDAYSAGAGVVATGRSDFPNQINNVLAFPGIFRGALDNKIQGITEKHKISAAKTIASLIKKPSKENIIPAPLDPELHKAVAASIQK